MLLVLLIVLLAFALSSSTVRAAVPFESALAVGGMAIITMALFQLGKLV